MNNKQIEWRAIGYELYDIFYESMVLEVDNSIYGRYKDDFSQYVNRKKELKQRFGDIFEKIMKEIE